MDTTTIPRRFEFNWLIGFGMSKHSLVWPSYRPSKLHDNLDDAADVLLIG